MRVRLLATLFLLAGLSLAAPTFADEAANAAAPAPSTAAPAAAAAAPATPAPDAPKPDTAAAKEKKGKGGKADHLGIIKVIMDHAADLGLNDDQKDKLKKLAADTEAAVEKLHSDSEVVALQAKVKEAKQDGDKDTNRSLHKELKELIEKKGGDPLPPAIKAAEAILTPEQLTKLKDYAPQQGKGDKKAAKADKKDDPAMDKKDAAATEKPADKPAETAATPAAPAGDGMGMDK